ncbi:heparinase II/III domain-containing protein [Haladaptatus sp. DFWS20]|uniref:heparinase II/III domain-containing protein n=1 Tax=Haladaptatus sp. DFWS20 TaxID=3403467 RepID=UPI003EBA1D5C
MSKDGTSGSSSSDWLSTVADGDWLRSTDTGSGRRDFMKASSLAVLGTFASSGASASTTGSDRKMRTTYYTDEKRRAALANIEQYDWAKEVRDAAVNKAETVLSEFSLDDLWHYVGSQDIPRASWLANGNAGYYPGSGDWDFESTLSGFGYGGAPGKQWKVTNGEYTLPTNDYAAYRESGLDDAGTFDPNLADDSLLVNEEHPEMGEQWGVDDGTGWVDENGDLGPAGTRWVPVAWAHHWNVIYGYREMLSALFESYLYTQKQRYATAAAVLLDRLADVYPEFNLQDTVYFEENGYTYLNGFPNNSHGGTGRGKQVGSIWESYWVKAPIRGYDAVFPAVDGDSDLTSFLSAKSESYPGIGAKSSVATIRSNIEDGLLRQILPAFKDAQIRGNFGSHQTTLALSAVVQDTPGGYTSDALDYLFKAGGLEYEDDGTPWGDWTITGGDVLASLLEKFDRDGHPFEGTIHYNSLVSSALQGTADALNGYDAYEGADLYQNPIFKQTFETQHPLTYLNEYVPKYGDTASAGDPGFDVMIDVDNLVRAYEIHGGDDLARWIYLRNGESMDGLRGDIFDPDPNSVKGDIQHVLDANGPLDLDSTQLAGLGLTALRAGTPENGRGIWTYYGRNAFGPDSGYGAGHCHRDTLNIGVFAHGLDLSPDLGYPEETGSWPKRNNWTANTISHNTVLVNEHRQEKQWVSTPKHFDHTDRVQMFEIDAANVYEEAEQYERTTAQIAVDDENSYAVDFFRVDGGDDHHFSFHGAKVPGDRFDYSLNEGVTAFAVRDGAGTVEATRAKAYTGETSVRLSDPSGDTHDWRGLETEGSADPTISVAINTAVTGYHEYWHHNHSVYLGRDANGRRVCAGLGNQAADDDPRVGIYYPESNEWGDYAAIDGWEKNVWYGLNVSKSGTSVEIEVVDVDGGVLTSGTFALDSDTDSTVGIFGGIGKGQTGALYFDELTIDGTVVELFTTSYVERSGIETTGLDLTAQQGGSYAGSDVPKPGHGEDTQYNNEVGNGFNYLYNVERDDAPGERFSVDWDIEDYWDALDEPADVHLRLTLLTQCDDVAIANGDPPQRWENPDTFKYVVAHRQGSALQSVFTSVIEPYKSERFISSISAVPVESDDPTAQAVRVKLKNGRTDYIASATDPDVMHHVGDVFEFKGAFAVFSTDETGDSEHAYLNDGKLLIPYKSSPLIKRPSGRIEGTIEDFTRDLSLDNRIEMTVTDGDGWTTDELVGSWVYADAVDKRNGAYEILDAERSGDDRLTLDIGERTTVKQFNDPENPDAGYEYILSESGRCVVPFSETWSARSN